MKLDFLQRIMQTKGISEHDLYKLMTDDNSKGVITDETAFAIVRYLNSVKGINVFFTRTIGKIEIRPRWFDVATDFHCISNGKTIACVSMQLQGDMLFKVEFPQIRQTLIINMDLLDYVGERDTTTDLRMRSLNEILTRYYSKILYAIYQEMHKRG